jgi:colanic acid biosynthesis protein WcaH
VNREPNPGERLEPGDFARIIQMAPLVAIDVVVRSPDGCVLVGRRNNEPARGFFFVPGGRITKNEPRAAAFRRITRAELGREMSIDGARLLGVYDHIYPANALEIPGFGTHYVTLGYELAGPFQPDALPRDQHAEYAWMSVDDLLANPEVHDNTKAYFRPAS